MGGTGDTAKSGSSCGPVDGVSTSSAIRIRVDVVEVMTARNMHARKILAFKGIERDSRRAIGIFDG